MNKFSLIFSLLFTTFTVVSCGGSSGGGGGDDSAPQDEESTGGTAGGTTGGTTGGTAGGTAGGTTGGAAGGTTGGTTGGTAGGTTGGTAGGTTGGTTFKPLFSRWIRTSDRSILDLRNARFNSFFNFVLLFPNGARCGCQMIISGSETFGSFTLTACNYQFGGNGDPGCFDQDGTSAYSKNGNFLNWTCSAFGGPPSCGVYSADLNAIEAGFIDRSEDRF